MMEKHIRIHVGLIVMAPLLLIQAHVKLNAIVHQIQIKFVESMELLIKIIVMLTVIELLLPTKEVVPKTALNVTTKFLPQFAHKADYGIETNALWNVTDKLPPKISGAKELSTDYLTE